MRWKRIDRQTDRERDTGRQTVSTARQMHRHKDINLLFLEKTLCTSLKFFFKNMFVLLEKVKKQIIFIGCKSVVGFTEREKERERDK